MKIQEKLNRKAWPVWLTQLAERCSGHQEAAGLIPLRARAWFQDPSLRGRAGGG